ncbi:hypothetical protein CANCADRAFT_45320 [Tortispora caseinolytica NRRL Y-17796]|uniref:Metallo-beta-lactamase domain-containing protein n=1 Tax=Tortispora caseinolytica NRRL Y-17796 TaxID=767744 RepID=A0A1E4TAV9_9ASCO|nr:hypothetical protein CANCADRAFT_45320 [Tortispora caseinolytica NRRL Y-17796]
MTVSPVSVLSPLVTRILGCNPGKFTLDGTNTYLVGRGRRKLLIDTGDGVPEYHSALLDYLHQNNVELSAILLTHWHPDHIGGVAQILDDLKPANIPIYKAPSTESTGPNALAPTLPNSTPLSPLATWVCQPIQDGQIFGQEEGVKLQGFYTPGHADDHFVFYLHDEDALFSGDNILGRGTAVFTDLKVYLSSLDRTVDLFGSKLKLIYPGHGPTTGSQGENQECSALEKINQYISHRLQREDEILTLMKERSIEGMGSTSKEIVEVIYKHYPSNIWYAAEMGINLHLKKLADDGKAYQKSNTWYLTEAYLSGKL